MKESYISRLRYRWHETIEVRARNKMTKISKIPRDLFAGHDHGSITALHQAIDNFLRFRAFQSRDRITVSLGATTDLSGRAQHRKEPLPIDFNFILPIILADRAFMLWIACQGEITQIGDDGAPFGLARIPARVDGALLQRIQDRLSPGFATFIRKRDKPRTRKQRHDFFENAFRVYRIFHETTVWYVLNQKRKQVSKVVGLRNDGVTGPFDHVTN